MKSAKCVSLCHRILTLTFAGLFMCATIVPGPVNADEKSISAKTYKKLKKDLKDELYSEIRAELYEELNANINQLVADNIRRELKAYIAQHMLSNGNEKHAFIEDDSQLDYVVHNTVRQIFESDLLSQYLSDEELDQIRAGSGIESDLAIKGGFNKSPQVTRSLLARSRGKATPMSKSDYDLAAGEIRQESIERTLQSKGSILLPKGTLQVEPSVSWSHFSSNRINIEGFSILPVLVIGDISVQETRRDILITSVALKYGIWENLQTEVRIPFRGQFNRDVVSETSETTADSWGIGDIDFGLSRQIAWESGIVPDIIASLNFKTKTGRSPYNRTIGLGSGHYSVRGSLVAAKSSDPAVIFGSLSYTHNFKEDVDFIGEVEPGSTIGYSLGMAIALSYQTAINFSFDHSITEKFKTAGTEVDGSFLNSANVKIGANWSINERSSVDFSVAFGVTDDAPDVSAEVRFPFIF